ncbi:AMP-dependent synthetase and ligase [Ferroglobus placidus DSM 10642]|uniref:AMP-dependent synthetase and ligase n=1 Tax=Ferroglobus placidus (strain DSM 10642 / AEDII12DO) TaxID=589924 RepID=D3S136_FERPA|nr:AMP-binding protein [Ferroglobus placidus]ADC64272.1 AMP-dependent synthetase and ligase [Ferroglobus placidus DSM 10642]
MLKDNLHDKVLEMTEKEKTVLTKIYEMSEKYPDQTALIFLGEKYNYKKLIKLIESFSSGISELGVKKGDRVMLYLPNSPQFLISYFGLMRIGAIPVPVSPIYTSNEIRYMLENSGAKVVICSDTNIGYVRAVEEVGVEKIVVTNVADMLPKWKKIVGELFDKIPKGSYEKSEKVFEFKKLLKKGESVEEAEIDPKKDIAHILYTGGTTGRPKGVVHTHAFLLSGIIGLRETYKEIKELENKFVVVVPLFHMFALDMIMSTTLHKANTAILMPKPNIDAILASIEYYEATLFAGVPTLYRMILEHDRVDYYDLSSLKFCWSAGDVLPAEVYKMWKEKFGIPLHQVYGSTETVVIAVTRLSEEPKLGSVGKIVPGRIAKIIDPETLEEVEGEGELIVTSEYLTMGYWRNPEETEKGFIESGGYLWCRTGDFVKIYEDKLYFVDRRKDIIKYKGYRIAASEVEAVLQSHPAVIAASVIGVPDERVGERIKAFVVLKEDARITAHDLKRWCRERLAPYKVPDYIEFRDFLPKSKVGKILRRELRDQELRRG